MPNLRIEYDGRVLYDGDVVELRWDDAPGSVSVVGRQSKSTGGGGGSVASGLAGIMEALSGASRKASDARRQGLADAAGVTIEPRPDVESAAADSADGVDAVEAVV